MSKLSVFTVAVLTLAASLFSMPAFSALDCGDTINTDTTLDADLLDCDTDPGLTVQGPAVLDLDGHTVTCSSGDGIHLVGRGAKLRNGVVEGCNDGIVLMGEGLHSVEGMLSKDNAVDGFSVERGSDKNRLDRNAAAGNGDDGFQFFGVQNMLTNNIASNNFFGFFTPLPGSSKHILRENTAASNIDVGFLIPASGTEFRKNVAQRNGRWGFLISSDGSNVIRNQAFDNEGVGIEMGGDNSKLERNSAMGNGNFDLVDYEDCSNNIWKRNIFGSANHICIQ